MGSHRSRLNIIADMLYAIRDKAKKTQIRYRANLSHGLLTRYLDELSISYLTRFEQSEGCYVLTAKGMAFLDQYENHLKHNKHVEKHIDDMNGREKALEELCSGNQEL